jgi:hypothetical protein
MPIPVSPSLSDQTSQAASLDQQLAQKSSGNWALINQQLGTGRAQLSVTQAATDSQGSILWYVVGGVAALAAVWFIRKRAA